MNEGETLARNHLNPSNSSTAMYKHQGSTVVIFDICHDLASNRCSQVPVDEDSSKRKQKESCNSMRKWEKAWTKLREFWWFFSLDLKEWLWLCETVTIKNLYDVLITLLIKIKQIQVD